MAAEELLKEASRKRARAEVGGAMEWAKEPKKLNKTFIGNTILQVTSSNNRKIKTSSNKK
jgi:hypothetical protein